MELLIDVCETCQGPLRTQVLQQALCALAPSSPQLLDQRSSPSLSLSLPHSPQLCALWLPEVSVNVTGKEKKTLLGEKSEQYFYW